LIAERDEARKALETMTADRDAWRSVLKSPEGCYGPEFAKNMLHAGLNEMSLLRTERDAFKSELSDLRQAHARLLQALSERKEPDDLTRSAEPDGATDSHPRSGEPKG
jgi:hypothetical protein